MADYEKEGAAVGCGSVSRAQSSHRLYGQHVDPVAVKGALAQFEKFLADDEGDETSIPRMVQILYEAVDGRPVDDVAAVAARAERNGSTAVTWDAAAAGE